MKTDLHHLQLNIDYRNVDFYKDLMQFLGWSIIFEGETAIGYRSQTRTDIWYIDMNNREQQNHDFIGLNHLALRAEEIKDVDAVVDFLKEKSVSLLFDTPRHRAEYAESENETYYQVMFESPDKILYEVVYIGQK